MLIDLHNHSCLSPCACLEQSPRALAERAAARGIGLLALTDHNSALNCPAFAVVCRERGILPLFGLEACTREEVHVLCLFADLEAALDFGEWAYGRLPHIPNDPERLGDQVRVDADETVLGMVERYLGNALDLGLDDLGGPVQARGGLVIPAHIDRPMHSMTSQLGFVAQGPWAALECLRIPPGFPTGPYPLITSSDAHRPDLVGRRAFNLPPPSEGLRAPDGGVDIAALAAALAALAPCSRQG
jgi:hypothetical protein